LQSGPLQAGHGWCNAGRMRLGLLRHARRTSAGLPHAWWLHALLLPTGLLTALLLNTWLRTVWRLRARQRRAAGLTGQRLA